ncbi:T9SS type B sorting domain-containing protein [Galbibacter sp. EGI 63066]|uniref:T9SS type B sorting domain-containing protein n=1 Tax=Galbibacter sp. EGI 63066 TaxID=2993559 RepID=UPI0022487E40|nr:T9SS type B sorting domain-containing protein [Galbibacter sp. EGI 63066]MCX2679085.1 T9SS type B sorting domain-containing protein [Galbibacter sp. EGI 63066]
MIKNYLTLRVYLLLACIFLASILAMKFMPDLSNGLGMNNEIVYTDANGTEYGYIIDNSESSRAASTANFQSTTGNDQLFAGEVKLIKTVEDINGNPITGPVAPGMDVVYVLSYENISTETVPDYEITDEIPQLVSFNGSNPDISVYNTQTRVLSIDVGALAAGETGEVRLSATVNDVENIRDGSISNQAFATYNNVVEEPSFSNDTETLATPTVFCLDAGENTTRTEVLCGNSMTITAGDGFDTYTWTRDGAFVANTQDVEITEEGTYVAEKTIDCDGTEITYTETVNVYNWTNITNPFFDQADNMGICSSDGSQMPNILLCNAGDTRTLETGFVDIQNIQWERLGGNATLQNCPQSNGDWNTISNTIGESSYTVFQAGSYRIYVQFQNGCFKYFYFNVYDGINAIVDIENYTSQHLGSINVDTQMNGGEFTYLLEGADGFSATYGPTTDSTHLFEHLFAGTYTLTVTSGNGCVYTETITVENNNPYDLCVQQHDQGDGNTKECDRAMIKVLTGQCEGDLPPGGAPKVAVWSYDGEVLHDSFQDIPWGEIPNQPNPNSQVFEIDYQGAGEYVFVTRYEIGQECVDWDWWGNCVEYETTYGYVISKATHIELDIIFEFDVITENVSCYGGSDGSVNLEFANPDDEMDLVVDLYRSGEDTPINSNISGTFPNLEPGDYDIVVDITIPGVNDKEQHCNITKSFTITQPDAPLEAFAGVVRDVSCWQPGDSDTPSSQVRITNVTGGTPPYEYNIDGEWRTDTDRLGYMSNDDYVYLRDANGCEFQMFVDVNTYTAPPELNYSVVYDCEGIGTATIEANVPNDSGVIYDYTFSLDNGIPQDSEVFENLEPGNYEVTVYYENVNPDNPTPSLLLEEDFGRGANTPWPEVNSAYVYESNDPDNPDDGDWDSMLDDGEYVVTQHLIPRNGQEWLDDVLDPEETGGRYLAINIGDAAGSGGVIYEKEIHDITPGTEIELNLNVINLLYQNSNAYDPEIKAVLVNSSGNIVSEDTAGQIENDEQWHDVSMTLNAGPNEDLTLQLISYSTEMNGNDIAIDGVKAYQRPTICSSSMDLAVTVDNNGGFAGEITGQSDTSCYDTADGSVTFTVSNVLDSTIGYEYRYSTDGGTTWEGGWISETATEVTIGDLEGGDEVFVQVRDANDHDCGFDMQTEIPIQVPDPIDVDAEVDMQVGCGANNGGVILVTASGGTPPYEYQLSDSSGVLVPYEEGGTQHTFENVAVGSYTVTVRDTNQCTEVAEDVIEMVEPATIAFTANAVDCYNGSNGTIDVAVSSGNGDYQFSISPEGEVWDADTAAWFDPDIEGGTEYTFDNLTPGTYTVYVKDGYGCIDERTLTINPQMTLSVTSTSSVSCLGAVDGEAELTVNNLLAPPYSYTVNGTTEGEGLTANTITLEDLDNGIYEVEVTDNNGCTDDVTITIDEPTAALTLNEPVIEPIKCSETGYTTGSVTVSAQDGWGSYEYTLTYPDGTTTDTGSGASHTFTGLDQTGTYTVTVIDDGGEGCEQTDTFDLVQPTPPTVTPDADNDICMDDDGVTVGFTITEGVAPYYYSRDNGSTWTTVTGNTFDITVNTAQTLDVLVRDAYGCESEASATVDIGRELTASADSPKGLDCSDSPDATIQVNISGGYEPYTYTVNGDASTETTLNLGETSFTHTASTDGTYTFDITDDEGCTAQAVFVIDPLETPTATSSKEDVTCFGGNNGQISITPDGGLPPYDVHLTGPNGYDETFTSNGTEVIFVGLVEGTYTYTVTDENECGPEPEQIYIDEPDALVLDISASVYTCNQDATLTVVTAQGGSGNYQFQLNGGAWITQAELEAITLEDGTHEVTIRDANATTCTVTEEEIIDPLPTPPDLDYTVTYSCDGTGIVRITPLEENYTYSLDGATPQDNTMATDHNVFEDVAVGTHTVTVNYGSECTEEIIVLVEDGQELQAGVTDVQHILCYGETTGSLTFEVSNFDPVNGYDYIVSTGGTTVANGNGETTSPITVPSLGAGDYAITITDPNDSACSVPLTQTLSQPLAALTADAVITAESRCSASGSTPATVTVTAGGGTAPYQYRMDGGAWQPTNTFSATPGVAHTFEVMDDAGCEAEDDTPPTIEEPETLAFDLEAIDCYQGDYQGWIEVTNLTGNGDYQYRRNGSAWTDLPTDNIITGLPAGTHTIEVRDRLGCTANFQNITIHPELTLTAEATDFTSCSQGSITATANGGDSSATYEYAFMATGTAPGAGDWGSSNSLTNITAAGTYDVYVRYNSGVDGSGNTTYCQAMVEAIVDNAPPMDIDIDETQPVCFGDTGEILMTIVSGRGAFDIVLENNTTSTEVLHAPDYVSPNEYPVYNLEPGDYTMTVTDRYGCEDVETFTIIQPVELTADIEPVLPATCDGLDANDYGFEFVNYTPTTDVEFSDDNGATWDPNPVFTGHLPGTVVRPAMRTVDVDGNTLCMRRFPRYTVPYPLDELLIQVEAVVECNTLTVEVQGTQGDEPYEYAFTDNIETFDPDTADWYPGTGPTSGSFIFDETHGLIPGRSYTFLVRDEAGCIRQSDDTTLYDDVQEDIPILISVESTPSCAGESTGTITFTLDGSNLESQVPISWELFDLNNQTTPAQTSGGSVAWPGTNEITVENLTPNTSYYIVITTDGGITGCTSTASGSANEFIEELQPVTLLAETERDITCANPGVVSVDVEGGSGNYTYTLSSPNFISDIVSTDENIFVQLTDIDDTTDTPITITVSVVDEFECTTNTQDIIMHIAQPPAVPDVNVASCDPDTGATLTITMPPGGAEPYMYSIDDGVTFEDSNIFNGLAAGTYDVVVRDNNGCESTTAEPVEIYEPMQVDATLTQELYCSNNYAEVTIEVLSGGSGDFTYDVYHEDTATYTVNGDPMSSNPMLQQVGDAGTYTITVHDVGTGCDSQDISIEVPARQYPEFEVVPSSTSDVSCYDAQNGVITVTATGDDGPYTFMLTELDGAPVGPISPTTPSDGYTAIFEGLDYGTWTIEAVSDVTGCPAEITHEIEEPAEVIVPNTAVSATPFDCTTGNNMNDAVITVDPNQVTGGSTTYTRFEFIAPDGTTVLQDSASPEYIVEDTSGGTYTVNVYDSNGCIGTQNIEIDPFVEISDPMVAIDNAITCNNLEDISVTVTETGGSATLDYHVDGTDNAYDENNATGIFTGLDIGNYLITVTNTDTGCYVQTTHRVTDPDTFDLDAIPAHVSCYGVNDGSVTLNLDDLTDGYTGDFEYEINGTRYDGTTILAITNTSNGLSATETGLYAGTYTVTATLVDDPGCVVEADFNITQPDALVLTVEQTINENCNALGRVTLSATGGSGNYEYAFVPEGTTPTDADYSTQAYENLAEGEYTAWVRDANANTCSIDEPFDIGYDDEPEISLLADNVCAGEGNYEIDVTLVTPGVAPYTVSVDGGAQQAITFNSGIATISGLTSGNHTVEVYDANGCPAIGETQEEIHEPLRVDAVMTQPLYCNNNYAEITLTVEGGSGDFTYDVNWVEGSTWDVTGDVLDENPKALQYGDAGTYIINVNDIGTGCESNEVTVVVPPRQYPDFTVLDYDNISCYDAQNGRIVVQANGTDSPYTFAITELDGANISNIAPDESDGYTAVFEGLDWGVYTIEAISQVTGCSSTVEQEITEPQPLSISAGITDSCDPTDGYEITVSLDEIGTPPYTLSVNGALSNVSFDTNNEYVISGLTAGDYNIEIRDANGCTAGASNGTQTITPLEFRPLVTTLLDCEPADAANAIITLDSFNGSRDYSYSITGPNGITDSDDIAVTPFEWTGASASGDYIITITDDIIGCSVERTVTVPELLIPDLEIVSSIDEMCSASQNGQIVVRAVDNGIGPFTFEITAASDGSVTTPITPSSATGYTATFNELAGSVNGIVYTITATADNSCTDTISETITAPAPIVITPAVTVSQFLCNADSNITEYATITVDTDAVQGGSGNFVRYQFIQNGNVLQNGSLDHLTFTDLNGGTVTVNVYDDKGCSGTMDVPIDPFVGLDDLELMVDSYITCSDGEDITATVSVVPSGAAVNLQYTIEDTEGNIIEDSGVVQTLNHSFTNLQDGAYFVTVLNTDTGCEISASHNINNPADSFELTAQQNSPVTCYDTATGTVTLTMYDHFQDDGDQSNDYNYTITGVSDTSFVTSGTATSSEVVVEGLSAGTYEVSAQLNGIACSVASSRFSISQSNEPLSVIMEEVANVTCPDHQGEIYVNPAGGYAPYDITLYYHGGEETTEPVNNPSLIGTVTDVNGHVFIDLQSGLYQTVVTDSQGCVVDAELLKLTRPEWISAEVAKTNILCNGEAVGEIRAVNVTGGAGEGNYYFALTNVTTGVSSDTQESPVFSGLTAGTYTVTIFDAWSCDYTSEEVTIEEPEEIVFNELDKSNVVCHGADEGYYNFSVSGGTGPYDVRVFNDTTGEEMELRTANENEEVPLTELRGGVDYRVLVNDANGCEVERPFTIPSLGDLTAQVQVGFDCQDNTAVNVVRVSLPDSDIDPADVMYALNSTDVSQAQLFDEVIDGEGIIRNVTPEVEHYITIFYEGCDKTIEEGFTVDSVDPLVMGVGESNLNEFTMTPSGGSGPYEYFVNGVSQGSDATYVIRESGIYEVMVVDANGCSDISQIEMEFIDVEFPPIFTPNGDGENDGWGPENTLHYPKIMTKVYDRYGRVVAELDLGEEWDGKYNGKELPTGDYWYVVRLNGEEDHREFVGHFTLYR